MAMAERVQALEALRGGESLAVEHAGRIDRALAEIERVLDAVGDPSAGCSTVDSNAELFGEDVESGGDVEKLVDGNDGSAAGAVDAKQAVVGVFHDEFLNLEPGGSALGTRGGGHAGIVGFARGFARYFSISALAIAVWRMVALGGAAWRRGWVEARECFVRRAAEFSMFWGEQRGAELASVVTRQGVSCPLIGLRALSPEKLKSGKAETLTITREPGVGLCPAPGFGGYVTWVALRSLACVVTFIVTIVLVFAAAATMGGCAEYERSYSVEYRDPETGLGGAVKIKRGDRTSGYVLPVPDSVLRALEEGDGIDGAMPSSRDDEGPQDGKDLAQ